MGCFLCAGCQGDAVCQKGKCVGQGLQHWSDKCRTWNTNKVFLETGGESGQLSLEGFLGLGHLCAASLQALGPALGTLSVWGLLCLSCPLCLFCLRSVEHIAWTCRWPGFPSQFAWKITWLIFWVSNLERRIMLTMFIIGVRGTEAKMENLNNWRVSSSYLVTVSHCPVSFQRTSHLAVCLHLHSPIPEAQFLIFVNAVLLFYGFGRYEEHVRVLIHACACTCVWICAGLILGLQGEIFQFWDHWPETPCLQWFPAVGVSQSVCPR